MQKFEQYFNPQEPLSKHFLDLCDANKYPDLSTPDAMRVAMRLATKYFLEYCQVTTTDIPTMRREAIEVLTKADSESRLTFERNEAGEARMVQITDSLQKMCAGDTRKTALLILEIASQARYTIDPSAINKAVEFGSGSGVLMMGMAASFYRSGMYRFDCRGYEIEPISANRSRKILAQLGDGFEVLEADVTDPVVYEQLAHWAGADGIRYIVSETINQGTPTATATESGIEWGESKNVFMMNPESRQILELLSHLPEEEARALSDGDLIALVRRNLEENEAEYRRQGCMEEYERAQLILDVAEKDYEGVMKNEDPFVTVMNLLFEQFPDLVKQIKNGKTALFPNVLKQYVPGKNATIAFDVLNGRRLTLPSMGDVLKDFEDFGFGTRWN